MRYYWSQTSGIVAVDGDDAAHELTAASPGLNSFRELARTADNVDESIDDVAARHLDDAPTIPFDPAQAADLPLTPDEIWAAGVTYKISEEARTEESDLPDQYVKVYDADRPELFFKATPSRTVGPRSPVGIRRDSEWDVPEPELGVVLYRGEVVGFTIGNDVSSRSIEGENSLYLPQAKVYDRCCSIGPCVASDATIDDPHDLEMSFEIERDGDILVEDSTSTGEMVRTCEELVGFLTQHNAVPELSVLLTGTSLVPPDDFTLQPDDVVRIDIESIGTLTNSVVEV
jgi:2-dehydro-3-deoxy-D-arabinonate dehydratase